MTRRENCRKKIRTKKKRENRAQCVSRGARASVLSNRKNERKNEVGRCVGGSRKCIFRLVIIE